MNPAKLDRISAQGYRQTQRMRVAAPLCSVLLSVLFAASAQAAFPTRVKTAVEPGHMLPEFWLGVGFEHRRKSAKINREWVQRDENSNAPLAAEDVGDLDFSQYEHRLNLDLRVGIFRDLELRVRAPIVLAYRSSIDFQDGRSGTSTIFGNSNFANNPAFDYRYPITQVPAERQRAGFGDMVFGLAWSPLHDGKDEAYPTLTLAADITAPTGSRWDPADQAALVDTDGTGGVGLGQTVFDLSVGLSKRMRIGTPVFDPYVVLGARLPVATPTQRDLGMQPAFSGRVTVGSELVVHERVDKRQRYAIDVSFGLRYVGIGRTYSELSDYLPNFDQTKVPGNRAGSGLPIDAVTYDDYANPDNYASQVTGAQCGVNAGIPCGELNRVDEHLEMAGTFALHIQPSEWFTFRGGVTVGFVSNHMITAEKVGQDLDPADAAGQTCGGPDSPCVGRVNAQNSEGVDERSPYYDPRYDQPGRRLLAEGIFTLTAFATLAATF